MGLHEAAAGTLWLPLAEGFMVLHPQIPHLHVCRCHPVGSDILPDQDSEIKPFTLLSSMISLEVI